MNQEPFTPDGVDVGDRGNEGAEAQARSMTPEALLGDKYPIEANEILNDMREARERQNWPLLHDSCMDAFAYMDGLTYGKELAAYDLHDESTIALLRHKLTSREGLMESATNTPSTLEIELNNTISYKANDIAKYLSSRERWRERKYQSRVWFLRKKSDLLGEGRSQQDIVALAHEENRKEEEGVIYWSKKSNKLKGLGLHSKARRDLNMATYYRVLTSRSKSSELDQAKSGRIPEMDKADREGEFGYDTDWGEAVNKVMVEIDELLKGEEILKVEDETNKKGFEAVKDVRSLLVSGFNAKQFAALINHLGEFSHVDKEKRMDVVFAAWKEALLMGIFAKYAWNVDEDGDYKFGSSPFITELEVWHMHTNKKRAKAALWRAVDGHNNVFDLDRREVLWGSKRGKGKDKWKVEVEVDDNDESLRKYEERLENYIVGQKIPQNQLIEYSDAGDLFTIGRVVPGIGNYLENVVLDEWTDPVTGEELEKISLYDIWTDHKIGFASKEFPWLVEEVQSEEIDDGSVGAEWLSRIRWMGIVLPTIQEGLRSGAGDLNENYFKTKEMKAWGKLGLVKPGGLVNDRLNNPFAWLLYRHLYDTSPFVYGNKNAKSDTGTDHLPAEAKGVRGRRTLDLAGSWSYSIKETGEVINQPLIHNILHFALSVQAISPKESAWIYERLVPQNKRKNRNPPRGR